MNYKVLYRKYRPDDFDSLIGQKNVTELLKNAIKEDKISHAYIFTGPRGTGKTSSAKIFAKAINCTNPKDGNPCNKCEMCLNIANNPDVIEIDAASNNGVDDIRELIENSRLAPAMSKYKVYIIDEFHMLSTSAFNALLLTLEEPTKNVVFILATTDIQSVPLTVLSRCQRFNFKLLSFNEIVDRIKEISKKEKIKIDDDAINEIAYMSNGGMRDALSILDQVSSYDKKIELSDIIDNFGSVSTKKVYELIEVFSKNDVDNITNIVEKFKSDGVDYRILVLKLIDLLKKELIKIKTGENKYNLNFDSIYNMIFDLSNSITVSKNAIDPYIFIELALIKYTNADNSEPIVIKKEEEKPLDNNEIINKEEVIKEKEEVQKESIEEHDETKDEEPVVTVNTNKCSINIDVRVNNTFVNAKKEYLLTIKEKWDDFLIDESNANKKLMSYILDTDIVVASDKYAILTNNKNTNVELINENIKYLETDFNLFYKMDYKLVCLTNDMWKTFKEKYIFNIKNNIKYSIIDEVEVEKTDSNSIEDDNIDELEKLAAEIFENNVEIR